jgi:hypothetical protein
MLCGFARNYSEDLSGKLLNDSMRPESFPRSGDHTEQPRQPLLKNINIIVFEEPGTRSKSRYLRVVTCFLFSNRAAEAD